MRWTTGFGLNHVLKYTLNRAHHLSAVGQISPQSETFWVYAPFFKFLNHWLRNLIKGHGLIRAIERKSRDLHIKEFSIHIYHSVRAEHNARRCL